MKIQLQQIGTDYRGGTCLVHARGAKSPDGTMRITMQPLRLSGCDVFYGMQMIESTDGGENWSQIRPCPALVRRPTDNGMEWVLCDATPMYHKKTGTWLEIGVGTYYLNDELPPTRPRCTLYTVFDEQTGQWLPPRKLEVPADRAQDYARSGNGCGQSFELDNGDILVPVYYAKEDDPCFLTAVLRCSFDGQTLRFAAEGNSLTVPQLRGLGEESVMGYQGKFYACLRNDETGYVARSDDGLNYYDLTPLCFDDGTNVGNYNTQQHWIRGGGKLYLVYTRRGLNNDHVFRHRAPLVIAEFDPENLCLIRSTEQIVIPERGARLGNFGCSYVSEQESYVIASEWMQPADCEKYGSDNSLFVARLTF